MKRLLLVFGLAFVAGCSSGDYVDPRAQLLQIKADELHNMGLAYEAESKQLLADANNFYGVRLPSFLSTLDNNQLDAFNEFFRSAQSNNPVVVEKAFRLLKQSFSIEQQVYIVQLLDEACEITRRKKIAIANVEAYIEKQKELQDYGNSILQANQQEADLRRQRMWYQYQLQQQQNNYWLQRQNQTPQIVYPQQPSYYVSPPDLWGGRHIRSTSPLTENNPLPENYYITPPDLWGGQEIRGE
jgi:hypothetical protein